MAFPKKTIAQKLATKKAAAATRIEKAEATRAANALPALQAQNVAARGPVVIIPVARAAPQQQQQQQRQRQNDPAALGGNNNDNDDGAAVRVKRERSIDSDAPVFVSSRRVPGAARRDREMSGTPARDCILGGRIGGGGGGRGLSAAQ